MFCDKIKQICFILSHYLLKMRHGLIRKGGLTGWNHDHYSKNGTKENGIDL